MTTLQTVLAVDDSAETLALICSQLADEPYIVRPADSGELALEAVRRAPPDLMLLDLRMPGMDGLEVIRRLKADAATAQVPVILVSGEADTGEWVAGLQLGAVDYLGKPFRSAELRTRVRTQLALAAARRALAQQADELRTSHARLAVESAERQQAQRELRAQDRFYQEQFDRNPMVTLLIDPDTAEIIEANEAAIRYYGYPREQLLRRPVSAINGLSTESVREKIQTILRDRAIRVDMQHRLADGTVRDVRVVSSPVHFGGRVVLQSFVEDITEQRRAERDLAMSEERYRLLVDMSPDAIVAHVDGRLVFVNDACVRMMGASSPAELLGRSIRDFIHPDHWAASAERTRRVLEEGERAPMRETVFVRVDGQPISVESTGCPITFDGQRAALATFRDVSARKRDEEALRENAARYRLLTEDVKDVVWVMDAATLSFDYVSPAVERLRGYTPEEVMAMPMTHALANDAAEFVRALMADRVAALEAAEAIAAAHGGEAAPSTAFYTEEVAQPCKDGSTVWTEVITNFYRDPASGRVKIRGVTRDISERRRAEEERARLGAHLQQAQKMESVGRLAGGIAHDFNNMLSVILGNIELALHEVAADSQVHADLLEVQRAARHSADITRQLLAYARRQPVSPTSLDINASVAKSLSLLRPLLGEDLAVQWQPGAGLWHVLMDAAQLDQVVTNLCVNARDAIPGAGRLTLSTDNVTLDAAFCAQYDDAVPGDYVRLTVADDGVGMPPEIIGKIFEPFFTTKPVGEGTGLGLATVYGAVRQNGGFVRVASEAGLGTTFDVYLPRHVATVRAAAEPAVAGPAVRGHDTILLVEDEPAILRLATRALTAYGYTVIGARSPEEALRVAAGHPDDIHLLLTDVVMPVMNGRQLADALRLSRPGIACLFMSGYSGAVLSDHGVGDDAPFISKPFALRTLADKVRAVLDDARVVIQER